MKFFDKKLLEQCICSESEMIEARKKGEKAEIVSEGKVYNFYLYNDAVYLDSVKIAKIKPEEVKRDEDGFWTHSQFPAFGENVSETEMLNWFFDRALDYKIVWFESCPNATEEMHEAYFDNGEQVPQWDPKCDIEGSFLFSIHDTEDGPVAIFANPLKGDA